MLLVINNSSMVLHTSMTPFIMSLLPLFEGRRKWLVGGGLSLEPTGHNINTIYERVKYLEVKDNRDDVIDAFKCSINADFVGEARKPTYKSKTEPYKHQKEALNKSLEQQHFGLFMEQGTGKTKVAIDRAGMLHAAGRLTGVLIVAPKGVHRQWIESQVPEHFGDDFTGLYWPMKELPQELLPGCGLKFLSINIDAIKTDKGNKLCFDFLVAHRGKVMMIIDESHTIKNQRSQRWKKCNDLGALATFRMILTGTPVAKDLTDEWSQLKWLDERIIGIRYANSFRNEYCIMGGFEGRVVVSHKNVDRFRSKVDPFTFRATKEQIGILPKQYSRWGFDLSKVQHELMSDMKNDFLCKINSGEIADAANAAVAVLRLQQISNGFLVDGSGDEAVTKRLWDSPLKNPRIEALMDYIFATEGQIIIWARFVEDIKWISDALRDAGETFVDYYGGTKDADRAKNKEKFLNEEVRIFLSNPQAGGTGLNLQGKCNNAVYYSNSHNSIDRWQSEDRIHRIGTNGIVVYTDLVAKGSLDSRILLNLRNKKSISELALSEIKEMIEEM